MKKINNWKIPFFHQMKLKTKLLWVYGILILVPLIMLSFFVFQTYSAGMKNQIMYSANQSFSQTYDFLDYKFSKVADALDQLSNNEEIRKMITEDMIKKDIKQQYWNMLSIRQTFQELENEEDVSRIRVYVEDHILYAEDKINMFGLGDIAKETWFRQMADGGAQITGFTDNAVLSFASRIKSVVDYRQTIGYMRVDIQKSNIENILKRADVTEDSMTCIVAPGANTPLYSTRLDGGNIKIACSVGGGMPAVTIDLEESERKFIEEDEGFTEITVDGKKMLMCQKYLYHSGWTMLTVIPYETIMHDISSMQVKFFGIMLIASVVVFFVIYLTGRSITDRVERLVRHMQKVQKGETGVEIGSGGGDEIGALYQNFDYMIHKTNDLMDEKYELGKHVKNAELQALQSQINPHFLYNTLDMIKWFSYVKKTDEINQVVTQTAKFYKMTLNKGKSVVTIGEEIEHARAYLSIQNMRFEDAVKAKFDVPEEMLRCPIPKITLQPLIENAILHGIMEKDDPKGNIILTGSVIEGRAVLYLGDDGVGMDHPDKILTREIQSKTGSGYGVRNIHERILLLCGEGYGLEYKSNKGEGTTVEIHLKLVTVQQA